MTVVKTKEPKWLTLARANIGKHEIKGKKDNPDIMKYYADAGHPGVKHDETPWCAAFVGAMLERCGTDSSKSLAARSYLNWGKALSKPKPGCICVFWRGSPNGWQGHVGFYAGEDGDDILLLGGNQHDQVSISRQPKKRLLGYRWPITATNSRTLKAVALNAGGAVAVIAPALTSVGKEVKSLGAYGDIFTFVGVAFIILASIAVIYARMQDLKEKGR
jgi:uncharacterized protein (TIGR02594 family)